MGEHHWQRPRYAPGLQGGCGGGGLRPNARGETHGGEVAVAPSSPRGQVAEMDARRRPPAAAPQAGLRPTSPGAQAGHRRDAAVWIPAKKVLDTEALLCHDDNPINRRPRGQEIDP